MADSPLNNALRQFDATEANLKKAKSVLAEVYGGFPDGLVFGGSSEHDNNIRRFNDLWAALPSIEKWKPQIEIPSNDAISQSRFDAMEIGEMGAISSVEDWIGEPQRLFDEYVYRFHKKRRQLVRDVIQARVNKIDECVEVLAGVYPHHADLSDELDHPKIDELRAEVEQINALRGSTIKKPDRWGDLFRHLGFSQVQDIHDFVENDWPAARASLEAALYEDSEPVPITVVDLDDLTESRPSGEVATKLNWERLSDDDFERLIFNLISGAEGYQNPQWLMQTRAPDRGRDLSVERIIQDPLGGTFRSRVIIQCKHWLSKSINDKEVATLEVQMRHWEPPKVNVCAIATTGRFTADAVKSIEMINQSDRAMTIEPWSESHLERVLASRPELIAEFGLR